MTENWEPGLICSDCAVIVGTHRIGVATWYPGACDICKQVTTVTETRDCGHLKYGWKQIYDDFAISSYPELLATQKKYFNMKHALMMFTPRDEKDQPYIDLVIKLSE